MATVNKDFKIKAGLVVEGTNGTINGSDIITEDAIVGGTQTNISVTYDAEAKTVSFVAENGVAGSDTDDLTEGTTNLYFTDSRAVTAVETAATSANTSGKIVKRDGSGNFAAGTISANGYNVQDAGSIFEDSGLIIQSNSTYPVLIQGDQTVEIKSMNSDIVLNADGNVYTASVSSGNLVTTQSRLDNYIGDVTVDGSTGNTITDRIGAVAGDLSDHISDTSTHGVTGDIVGTSDTQTLSNKTIDGSLDFGVYGSYIDGTSNADGFLTVHADQDLTLESASANIILNPDGAVFINTSTVAGNEVATHAYADNAADGAETAANGYTDTQLGSYTTTANLDTTIDGYGYIKSAALTGYATETYVGTAISNLVDSAPDTLNTLNELAAALGDDASFATTIATSIGEKVAKSGDTMTGFLTLSAAPTSDLHAATKKYVDDALGGVTNISEVVLPDVLLGSETATAGTSATTVDSWSATTYSTAKYLVQMKSGTNIHVLEVLVTVDGSNNVYVTEYAEVISNVSLGTTDAVYNAGDVDFTVTAANTGTSVKISKTLIEA